MSIFTKYNGDIFSHNSRVVLDGGIVESLDYLNEVSEETKRVTILPLEYYGKIKTAFSIRKVVASYSGPCLKVRRSSDNTELDISFFGNELDVTTLTNFVGSGDGFVTTWYDQSGGNLHITQTNTTAQPVVVSGGTIININGKIAIDFNGTTSGLARAGTFSNIVSNMNFFAVFRTKTSTSGHIFNQLFTSGNGIRLYFSTLTSIIYASTDFTVLTAQGRSSLQNTYCLFNSFNTPLTSKINNVNLTSSSGTSPVSGLMLGYNSSNNTFYGAFLAQEFIIYDSNNSGSRVNSTKYKFIL